MNWTQKLEHRSCPNCNSEEAQIISRVMKDEINLNTVICRKCSLVYSNPIPPREVYELFYKEAYNEYYKKPGIPKIGMQNPSKRMQIRLDLIKKYLPEKTSEILEIGSGGGEFLYWLTKDYPKTYGIEPGPNIAATAKAHDLKIINEYFENYNFSGKTYDMLVMFHVFEHFYDPNQALERFNNLLNDNAYLFIEVPNILKPYRSVTKHFLRYVHLVNYNPYSLKAILEKHGFTVVELMEYTLGRFNPWNLLVIAQKTQQANFSNVYIDQPDYKAIIKQLKFYQLKWKLFNYPYQTFYKFILKVLRKFYGKFKKILKLNANSSHNSRQG